MQNSVSDSLNQFIGTKRLVIKAEIQNAALICEHNLPFALADHLVLMQKSSYSDSKIADHVACSRTKATAIVKNVLGQQQSQDLARILQNNKFSLCLDESTDLSTTKILSLVVRVSINYHVRDYFFALTKVTAADAVSLYNAIVKSFEDHGINYKENMIGLAADGANNVTGKHNSVASLFKKDCSNLVIVKCVCHSFALCSSYACLKIPSSVESTIRDIYNYISNSPKRIDQFEKIAGLLEITPKKILHPSQKRWLSLECVVVRILELYEALKVYFGFQANIDGIDNSKLILNNLNDHIFHLYLNFLSYVLPIVNKLNRLFQSEQPQIYRLHEDVKKLVYTILDNFIKPLHLKNTQIENINYKHPHNLIEEDNMYLGAAVGQYLVDENIHPQEIKKFKTNCLSFYIELVDQIYKRFDFKNEILKNLAMLEPKKICGKEITSLVPLYKLFPNLVDNSDLQNLDNEFREIRNLNFVDMFGETLKNINGQDFWKTVLQTKCNDDVLAFPLMSKFVFNVLSLPHSSANVERTFSQININKTKSRNRLNVETLEGILLAKDYLKMNSASCHNLIITNELITKFNSSMYV